MNIGDINAHLLRGIGFQAVHELARLIDRQFFVLPDAGRRKEFDGIMMLRRRFVLGFEFNLRPAVFAFRIACLRDIFLLTDVLFADAPGVEGRARLLRMISHVNLVSRFARGLEGFGNDQRYDLSAILDFGSEILDRRRRTAATRSILYLF